jgi:hypothetical protein
MSTNVEVTPKITLLLRWLQIIKKVSLVGEDRTR